MHRARSHDLKTRGVRLIATAFGATALFFTAILMSESLSAQYNIAAFWRGVCRVNTPANFTWKGGGGDNNWGNASNWVGNVVPGSSDVAVFDCSCGANCNATINVAANIKGLKLENGYSGTITQAAGSSLTIGTDGLLQTAGTFTGGNSDITLIGDFALSGGTFTSTSGTFKVGARFTYNAGTFTHNGGMLYFHSTSTNASSTNLIEIPSGLTAANVRFGAGHPAITPAAYHWNLGSGQTLTILTSLQMGRIDNTGEIYVNNGTLDLRGNLLSDPGAAGGTTSLLLSGTALQTYAYTGGALPALTINKTGGNIVAAVPSTALQIASFSLTAGSFEAPTGTFTVNGDFTQNSGTSFVHNNGTLFFDFHNSGGDASLSINVPTSLTLGHLRFGGGNPGATADNYEWTIGAGQTLLPNNLTIGRTDTSGQVYVNGGLIKPRGNVVIDAGSGGGTSALTFTGTAAQTYTNNGGTNLSGAHIVDKASGTVSLASAMALTAAGQALTITSGSLDMAGLNLSVQAALTIGASGKLICGAGIYTSGSFTNNGLLDCAQVLAFTTQPSATATTWTVLAQQPTITLKSSAGHTSNASTKAVTLAAYTDATCNTASSSALIATTNPVAATAGVASFSGIQHNLGGALYIKATASGATPGCSDLVTVSMLPYTWTGAGGDSNWSTAANWSGNAVPGSTDTPHFDANCGASCNATINVAVSIAGALVKSVYNGTITQAAGQTLTLGSNDWEQNAGTFVGGDAAIVINSDFLLYGGSFTSTTANLTVTMALSIAAGASFNPNSGTVVVTGTGPSSLNIAGANGFHNLTFSKTGSSGTITLTGTLAVANDLAVSETSLSATVNGGTINVGGNVSFSGTISSGTTLLRLTGSANQTLSGTSTARLPSVEIASTGGTVTFSGTLLFSRNFTYTSGTVDTSAASVVFQPGFASIITTSAAMTFQSVQFKKTSSEDITINGTMSVVDLAINNTSNGVSFFTGTIAVSGNITTSGETGGGSATLRLAGNSNQTLTGTANVRFPNLEFASTGGTVTLAGTIDTGRDITYVSGTIDPGTSTVRLVGALNLSTISMGTAALNNLEFRKSSGTDAAITGVLKLNGDLLFYASDDSSTLDSGTVEVSGNIIGTGLFGGGTTLVRMVGSTNQSVTSVAGVHLPNFEIASTGGTVTLNGTIDLQRDVTYTSGTVAAGTSTVRFRGYGNTSNLSLGAVALNNVEIRKLGSSGLINLTGALKVNGDLTYATDTSAPMNGGTIEVAGNTSFSSGGGGTTGITFVGANAQTLSNSTGTNIPDGTYTVNKSGGSLSLTSAFTLGAAGQDLTITSGTLDMNGFALNVTDTLTIEAGGTLTCSGATYSAGTFANSGTLNCP